MNPPLRTHDDMLALQQGLIDGTIDAVATDHAPHAQHEKDCEWEIALNGITGLETSLPLMLTHMIHTNHLSWQRLVEVMAIAPRRLLRLDAVKIEPGYAANLTLIDPSAQVTITPEYFESKACNSAWLGEKLTGCAQDVFVDGVRVMHEGCVC